MKIFLNNKYTKIYFKIIKRAKLRSNNRYQANKILGKTEAHHVIPKSIIPNKNTVFLSIKEHFICHLLLVKMTEGLNKIKMEHAVTQFSRNKKLHPHQIIIALSYKHRPCSDIRKLNISKGRKNTSKIKCEYCLKETDPGNFTRYHGDNCKFNPNIDARIIEERSIKAKRQIEKSKKLGTFSKPKPPQGIFTCPKCNKSGTNYGNMKLHHFDNCGIKRVRKYISKSSCIKCRKVLDNGNMKLHRC